MREAGITVIHKLQLVDPDVLYHSIFFVESKLRIILSLLGVFSYLPTKPSANMLDW